MRIFLAALFFAAISALGMSGLLETFQRPSYVAFTTSGARISDPDSRRIDPGAAQTNSARNTPASSTGAVREDAAVATAAQKQQAENADRSETPVAGETGNTGSKPTTVGYAALTQQGAKGSEGTSRPETVLAGEIENTGTIRPANRAESAPAGDTRNATPSVPQNQLVGLLFARPEIKSASDLSSKTIAIDERQSSLVANIRAAIATAGATEFQVSASQRTAFGRLVRGEVPAALLTLAYPEAAEWLPEIAGFRVFRIPLPPQPLKPQTEATAPSNTRPLHEQVAAAIVLAEKVTLGAAASAPTANAAVPSDKTEPAPLNNKDDLVALLLARPDIKSLSDLTRKNVAIDGRQSASSANVRTAIVAAGALEVQVSEDHGNAFDRLANGEVSAAILTLASPEAAEWFPDIKGFKVFRIPLSPLALKGTSPNPDPDK